MVDNSPTFNFKDNNLRLGYSIIGTKYESFANATSLSGGFKTSYESLTHLFTDDYI